ncbi:hypothetical protein [Pseudoxanthomonas wuyuanensis]|nr:hypothetical protein [Pseudoxanthomonas wuyuanensis]
MNREIAPAAPAKGEEQALSSSPCAGGIAAGFAARAAGGFSAHRTLAN